MHIPLRRSALNVAYKRQVSFLWGMVMRFGYSMRILLIGTASYSMVAAQPGDVATAGADEANKAAVKSVFVAHQAVAVADARVGLVNAAISRNKEAIKTAAVSLLDAEAAKHFDVPMGEKIKAALAVPIEEKDREKYMEKPELVTVNPGKYAGERVYFVNGMATSRERAEREAGVLSDQLKRPVALVYNPTAIVGTSNIARDAGVALDVVEAVRERAWPLMKEGLVPDEPTRQMAWVLMHSEGRVEVVSHSQGCLIVRNALVLATRMGGDVAGRMEWVATGLPLRDEEIMPRPAGMQVIAHAADPVSQSVGMRLDPSAFTRQKMEAHYFSGYVGEVKLVVKRDLPARRLFMTRFRSFQVLASGES